MTELYLHSPVSPWHDNFTLRTNSKTQRKREQGVGGRMHKAYIPIADLQPYEPCVSNGKS
jgi:hypothetical protein